MRAIPILVFVVATGCAGRGGLGDDVGDDVGDDAPPTEVPACATDVADALAGLRVPGAVAGIVKDGELHCVSAAGDANLEEGREVTADTVFAWASVSKTVTATAAMILLDEGRFALDDDVAAYVTFPVANPNCPGDPITFRQLLTHTSSIIDNETIYDDSYTDEGDSPIELGDFVRGYVAPGGEYYDAQGNFADECPGEVNDYSNIAVGLLAHVVEEIAGQPFDELCRERIFEPLGMDETSFRLRDLDEERVAMPYELEGGVFVAQGHSGFPTYPDGLLRTSVPHLARFLVMNAELGELDGERVLEEATVHEMRRRQVTDLDDTQGLIWFYYDFGDHTDMLGHDGSDDGTSSLMFFDPATGAGALLVANGYWYDDDDDSPEADALLAELLDEAND
jgi:CubicO group peptidase (beta-lactamase class C family)